jgi:hypothetical protein
MPGEPALSRGLDAVVLESEEAWFMMMTRKKKLFINVPRQIQGSLDGRILSAIPEPSRLM